MKYLEAILIKFAMVFSVLFVILGIAYGVEVFEIFILSLIITAVGFIGDLTIYPKTSNKVATGGDFVLVFLIVWLGGLWLINNPDFSLVMPAIYSALLIAVGEWFFHIYLTKRIWEQKETSHTLKQEPNRK
ncbi:DUF2512 family protein [Microbacterium sp. APC 3898]|uniref:DUF2512 family protein n=2 Tax=Planococcus TaxID=1372 RepID=A0ABT7ZKK3_9BACL|nr:MULTISPECIES: DUF2512 family protein [Terrabacteria group]MBD8014773.1 DUF2512 family protein [Planococcus wigleyi]MDN3427643.1 DUF2512 family protein [Planococcus sp. APC 4016]MDN3499195.1 DUF2512 family protein [Microbacterium sp. APC 3898]